jgi:hypothetical protein
MDTPNTEPPAVAASAASATTPPEVAEKPAEPYPALELDPPHESGYGFGV